MSDLSIKKRFGELLDSTGQMCWEMDSNYRVIYANDLLIRTFGDPVGKICHEFMSDSEAVCPGCPAYTVFKGADRASSERLRRDLNGNSVWLEHTATPVKDDQGEIIGILVLMVDMTHRKQMEDWLKDSERLYRNLVEQVPDVLFSLDEQARFTFVNTQVEKFLGYPVQSILETPLEKYLVPEDRDLVSTILELPVEEIWDEEVAILDAKGVRKVARIRCKASFRNEDGTAAFEGVMRDRTVRRKLEEELKASREALVEKIRIIDELYEHVVQSGKCKAIEEHTAEVAHQLRQPLAIVGGFARRMAKLLDETGQFDAERQRQYTRIIMTEIQRLEKILDGLIDFTKRERLLFQRVNPHGLIEYILRITEPRSNEKRVKIHTNFGNEIGEVPLDPGRFQQLVLNLVANAIDSSPIDGTVVIETGVSIPSDKALKAGHLEAALFFEMKIRNNGPMIPPEDLQRVFNPFYTTKQHGTGLGLTISKKIAEDHFGSISVKSDPEGTTLTIWFPLTHPEIGPRGFYLLRGMMEAHN